MRVSITHCTSCRWLLTALTLITVMLPLPSQAQNRTFSRMYIQQREVGPYLKNEVANCMATRKQPLKALSTVKYLLGDDCKMWTDGVCLYESSYSIEDRQVYFRPVPLSDNLDDIIHIAPLKVKGRNITLSGRPDVKVGIEQVAGHILLVGRNAQGHPVMVLHNVTSDQRIDGTWTVLAQHTIFGNYTLPTGDNAVFGPKCPFYTGSEYDTDPDILNGYYVNRDFKSLDVLYGDGRVSRGDPSDPKWGKMPGGGGAAAIMGPMEWNLRFTVEGLQAVVRHDERFVAHMPAIGNEGDTVALTKVQTPYPGLEGKWAFASVIPLTDRLLMLFPKAVLKLMRGEIYARHGDTFMDAGTQRYFDAQPWYHRGDGKAISLTDVERFNYSLIKQVEASMP